MGSSEWLRGPVRVERWGVVVRDPRRRKAHWPEGGRELPL